MNEKEIEHLENVKNRYDRLKEYKEKAAEEIREISGCIPKPKGLFVKKCPLCSNKLSKPFVYYTADWGDYRTFQHDKCTCGYERVKEIGLFAYLRRKG